MKRASSSLSTMKAALSSPLRTFLPISVFSGLAYTFLHGAVGKALLQAKWMSLMVFPKDCIRCLLSQGQRQNLSLATSCLLNLFLEEDTTAVSYSLAHHPSNSGGDQSLPSLHASTEFLSKDPPWITAP